jgi:hypothetical protein
MQVANIETNVSTIAAANEVGIYIIPDLHPAIYRLSIQKEGFRTVVQRRVQLYVRMSLTRTSRLRSDPRRKG